MTSKEGIVLLEIETPRLKGDLVRLEDTYGRKSQPYESGPNILPLGHDRRVLDEPKNSDPIDFELHGCALRLQHVSDEQEIVPRQSDDIMMVLKGGLYSKDEDPILTAGDVVLPDTWNRLASNFRAPSGITILTINRA